MVIRKKKKKITPPQKNITEVGLEPLPLAYKQSQPRTLPLSHRNTAYTRGLFCAISITCIVTIQHVHMI